MLPQRVGDAALDRVGAFVQVLGEGVGGGVDDVGIVTETADQGVNAGAAVQGVVACSDRSECFCAPLPSRTLLSALPVPLMAARASEGQVLEVVAQRIGDAALDRVRALVQVFGEGVGGGIDNVGIVTETADQGVNAAHRLGCRCHPCHPTSRFQNVGFPPVTPGDTKDGVMVSLEGVPIIVAIARPPLN